MAKTLLFMIVIWTIPTVVAVEQAPDHPWRATAIGAGSVMLVTWLLMLYMGPPRAVSAGEGWLAIRNWRRVHWVRTDRLAKVKVIPPRVLILKDRDGRKVKMHLRELRWNAKVFDLFTRGLRHSVETGMKPMNKTTLRFLPLK